MTLEEAYRACAVEHYSTDQLRALQDVVVVEGGAWVAMQLFVPAEVLGMGFLIDRRTAWEAAADPDDVAAMSKTPGRYALWNPTDPETPLLGDHVDHLLQQLMS